MWDMGSDRVCRIGMGCIGGLVEASETPLEALEREIVDEAGCEARFEHGSYPFFFGPDKRIRRITKSELPRGAEFLWEHEEPGHAPGGRVAVFRGGVVGSPIPGDLPAIITLKPETLSELRDSNLTVAQLLENDGILHEKIHIPRQAQICPVGTVRVLTELMRTAPQVVEFLLPQRGGAEVRRRPAAPELS